jgi:hypothetical protein
MTKPAGKLPDRIGASLIDAAAKPTPDHMTRGRHRS